METIVSRNGRIEIPRRLLKRDDIRAGQRFFVERLGPGDYRLARRQGPGDLVAWLRLCPDKGFFKAPEFADSTDGVTTRCLQKNSGRNEGQDAG